jgi:hypothetical protein
MSPHGRKGFPKLSASSSATEKRSHRCRRRFGVRKDLLLFRGNLQIAVETDFERGAFIEDEIVARFYGGERAISRAFAGAGSRLTLIVVVNAGGCAFTRSHHDSFGNFFFRHALAADFAFFADLLQSVFTGHSCNGGDQGNPSVLSFDFVKAEQQARVHARFYSTDVTFDPLTLVNHQAAGWGEQRLGETTVETISGLDALGVETIGELDENDGPLRDDVRWHERGVLRGEKERAEQQKRTRAKDAVQHKDPSGWGVEFLDVWSDENGCLRGRSRQEMLRGWRDVFSLVPLHPRR